MPLEQFDWFPAEYQPQRRDDLKPAAEEWIGWRGLWEAAFVIDEGPYEGQFACTVKLKRDGTYGAPYPPARAFAWVPQCDLKPIQISEADAVEIEERAVALLRERQGPR